MSDYIYSAYIDIGYSRPDRVALVRVLALKRTEKQVWVKPSAATGYRSRLDANHNDDLNLGATPEEAMEQLRKRLENELAALVDKTDDKKQQLRLADTTPGIEDQP